MIGIGLKQYDHIVSVDMLNSFVKNLLNNVVHHNDRPHVINNGLLNSIGTAASYLLLLPWNAYRYFFPAEIGSSTDPISDLSLFTLLSMIQYHSIDLMPTGANPFRDIIHTIQDLDFADMGTLAPNTLAISMSKLYDTIIRSPSMEKNLLLLYYLLQNPNFFRYVQSRTDIDSLIMPSLHILYSSFEEKPQQVYLILIVVLMLTQDPLFNANVHSLIIHQVNWYKERHLLDISLGGLLMVILIKSIVFNLSKLRDVYLHTNCLAILANLSSSITNIHPYVASRMVKLLEILCKRYLKLKQNNSNMSKEGSPIDQQLEQQLQENALIQSEELQTHSDFLFIVLQIINSTLTYRSNFNPHLIYSLLHQSEYLKSLFNDENLSELATNISNILSFFVYELSVANVQEDWPAERILFFLESKSKQIVAPPNEQEGALRFKYEEEPNSHEFITPYHWQLSPAASTTDIDNGGQKTPTLATDSMSNEFNNHSGSSTPPNVEIQIITAPTPPLAQDPGHNINMV
ncbi:hypothetical protein SAMD00019534_050150 [Acytostelium subglobosum LB1]|uniref:hypothetical protein n=1 Tax=Acytostelium subglobosum LB1 TaxID=1410327 RepID=UPI00064514CD|nr:hypothetical protein SAMD00019534_050150 [Acytostelium subglobosum LB1]GAM21840.1 hypothetical protein SAMD00019534_050150 [Acytostelium subglobosum LB1]|eukprot:XP_012754940.1 hypothetical protein SAMD00019534_050150 [Acytostelium subglobosum LB1]